MDNATLLSIRIPAFDAAIRKALEPRLADRPVVIVTSFKPMGRVLSACSQARREGVREEMHIQAARGYCPDGAFFLPDRQLAGKMQATLVEQAADYSPLVESAGNGRILLDIRGTERLWGDGMGVAERLCHDVAGKHHLPAAAGLAVRRPWSLLASRSAGESGICLVRPGDEDAFLQGIPVSWVDGVGPRTRTRLLEMNIRTLGGLRPFSREEILLQFGPGPGLALWEVLHPAAWDPVASSASPSAGQKDSIQAEAALAVAAAPGEALRLVMKTLALQVVGDLRARDTGAARLRLTLVFADGVSRTASTGTGGYIQDEETLLATAARLLAKACDRRVRVTRMWLAAEKLASPERQGSLFDDPQTAAAGAVQPSPRRRLHTATDAIRKRFGDDSLQPAVLLSIGKRKSRAG